MNFRKGMLSLCVILGCFVSVLSGCKQTETPPSEIQLPTGVEESAIYVEPVSGISDSFIRGMDASSVLAEENSGVTYYNFDGEEQDVFKTLAQAGVNYIRLRVWNDPFDEKGNGYGGGNNDLPTAIELGKRASKYGMKVCIDFHYSDFWADPKRQHAPKAWADMDIHEKCDALYTFTMDSLTQLINAGVDVGMVQIGNEINHGMSGETDTSAVMQLLAEGSRAVREIAARYDREISVAVHYTRIDDAGQIEWASSTLAQYGIDYDIFGISYYPFWDGDMENMQSVVKHVRETYGKQVMIAETSYCYTSEDGDGSGNSLKGTDDLVEGYPATVQGQTTMIRDVFAAAHEAGAMGVFYWEGVWIPVGEPTANNAPLWEEFGSGWASSYAAEYDPEDAGLYYGGCSWDNQAMFDFDGHPLASLNVFKYLKYGATAPRAVYYIPEVKISCVQGETLSLPGTVEVTYNDGTVTAAFVQWEEIGIDTELSGAYAINGRLEDGTAVTCSIQIIPRNFVKNPGFEDTDTSVWTITGTGSDYQKKADDAHSGEMALHFYSANSGIDFTASQTFTDLQPGTYTLSAFAQGGDISSDSVMELYAITGEGEQTAAFVLTTWADWKNPLIPEIEVSDGKLTIGVRIRCDTGGWGTIDDFMLTKNP